MAWCFEGFRFDLRRGELSRPDGTSVALRPKAESLLRLLLSQPGRLFGKEELMAALWPQSVVTDDSLVQCVGELRGALEDQQQRFIKTVPRRGYRWETAVEAIEFAEPVESLPSVESWRSVEPAAPAPPLDPMAPLPPLSAIGPGAPLSTIGAAASAEPASAGSARPKRSAWGRRSIGWLAGAVLLSAIAAWLLLRGAPPTLRIDEALAARYGVAVMPFSTDGDDPALRTLAATTADEIAGQLATRTASRVIGPRASSAFATPVPSLERLVRELKVKYVVTGRARSGANGLASIDVLAQKTDDGAVFWSQHFETIDVGGKPTLDVAQIVTSALRGKMIELGAAEASRPGHQPDAAELTLIGWREIDLRRSPADIRRARGRFEAALREDPHSIVALNGLGATYLMGRGYVSRLTAAESAEAERVIELANNLAPDDSTAAMLWGIVQLSKGRADLALPAFDKAIRIVPSYPNGHVLRAEALLMLGRTGEVQAEAARAVQLGVAGGDAPRVSSAYLYAAEAALMRGEDAQAYDLARRAVAERPGNAAAHALLAAIDALAGRSEPAAAERAVTLRLWPTVSVATYDEWRKSKEPAYLSQRVRLNEGLRRAGFAE